MSNWNEQINLVTNGVLKDEDNNVVRDNIGKAISEEQKVLVWAKREEVTRSEFYSAGLADIRIAETFIVHPYEYSGQYFVEFEGKTYKVVRTYKRSSEELELHCEEKIGDRNGT